MAGLNTSTPAEAPWYAAYPPPRTTAASLSRGKLLQWLQNKKQPGRDFILVDLRRTDFEGGTIQGSLNLPAHSLYVILPTFYALASKAQVKDVVWYCGSSQGRGTRAAGWFADYLEDRGDFSIRSWFLDGGVKGWAAAGEEYTEHMDGYDASVWAK